MLQWYLHPVFKTTQFLIDKSWKQPVYSSTDDWLKNVLFMYNGIQLCYKNDIFWTFEKKWIYLEKVNLNETNQTHKFKDHIITSHLTEAKHKENNKDGQMGIRKWISVHSELIQGKKHGVSKRERGNNYRHGMCMNLMTSIDISIIWNKMSWDK